DQDPRRPPPRWPFRPEPSPGEVRGDAGSDVREELELHLELRTEELIARGMDRNAARREAEARFGSREEVERRLRREAARTRDGSHGRWMMGRIGQDFAYALRGLRRNKGFAAVAVLTLAIALASNTAIFSVLDAA